MFIAHLRIPASIVFRDTFNSFLSFAATTPHKFIITGDFKIHLNNSTDHFTSHFLSLLSAFSLTLRNFISLQIAANTLLVHPPSLL